MFRLTSRVKQSCSILPFLFNLAIDDILETVLQEVHDGCVDLLLGGLFDFEYADDTTSLCNNTQAILIVLKSRKYDDYYTSEK